MTGKALKVAAERAEVVVMSITTATDTSLADYYADLRYERAAEARYDHALEMGWIRDEDDEPITADQMSLDLG